MFFCFKINFSKNSLIRRIIIIILIITFSLTIAHMSIKYFEKNFLYPLKHTDIIINCADQSDLDRALVFSIVNVESSFNENAKSPKGAIGLMQITPDTAEYIAKMKNVSAYDLYSPQTNVCFGCYYLKYLINKFINVETAIVAYNAGEGNVKAWLRNNDYSKDGITLTHIPFTESRNYLEKITKSFVKYNKLYGNILDKQKKLK